MKKSLAPVLFFCAAVSVFAQGENAVILSVRGSAGVKTGEGAGWQKAEKDMLLGEGALVSTGFRSSVEIFISGFTFTVKPLSVFRIEIPEYIRNVYSKKSDEGEILLPGAPGASAPRARFGARAPVGFGGNVRDKGSPDIKRGVYLNGGFDDLPAKSGFPAAPVLVPPYVNLKQAER